MMEHREIVKPVITWSKEWAPKYNLEKGIKVPVKRIIANAHLNGPSPVKSDKIGSNKSTETQECPLGYPYWVRQWVHPK